MDYCTYGYMIDNVVLLVSGSLHDRDVGELLEKCHPLGMFDQLAALAVASNMQELYQLVLIDTPLAKYFEGSLSREGEPTPRLPYLHLPPFPLLAER